MVMREKFLGLKCSFFFRSILNHRDKSDNWIERHQNDSKNITQYSTIGIGVRYFLSFDLGEVFLECSTSKVNFLSRVGNLYRQHSKIPRSMSYTRA